MKELADYVRSIKDFPKEGIIFRDITTVLQDKDGYRLAIDKLIEIAKKYDFDYVAGAEARGFILGAPIAYELGKGFIPIRKKGKLPGETVYEEYELEYGKAAVEIHKDAIKKGEKVLLVDDLIATGGTIAASAKLIESLGAEISAMLFLIELVDLKGREKLSKYNVESVLCYEGE